MQRSLILLLLLLAVTAKSQIATKIFIEGVPTENKVFADSMELVTYTNRFIQTSIQSGYYFAGLDSSNFADEELNLYLHKGKKVRRVGVDGNSHKNLAKYLTRQIEDLSNNGYPFARIQMDSSRVVGNTLTVSSVLVKGPLIKNDSAFFYEPIKTNHSYVYQLLDHIPGKAFSQRNYQAIEKKIRRVSFLSLKRPADISFQKESAKVYLDIEEIPSSSFRGVLGLQQQNDGSNLVGSLDLNIQNLFRSGKQLSLNWERFAENSQDLMLYYKHPFFLGSKLAPSIQFEILRQDTTFLTRSTFIGLATYFSTNKEIRFDYNRKRGTLLTTDEEIITNGNLADYTSDLYRTVVSSGEFERFNRLNNELAWEFGIGLGSKRIDRNLNIADSFYDTLAINTDIFSFDLRLGRQFLLGKRQAIYPFIGVGLINNDELLNNERYRIGGLNSLRGFNEKFFFADRYVLSRIELRSFFERGSYLYVFYDQLIFENNGTRDSPFGTGLGFSLETLTGQFSFAMALGKSKDQSFDLANLKIHFGYLTRF